MSAGDFFGNHGFRVSNGRGGENPPQKPLKHSNRRREGRISVAMIPAYVGGNTYYLSCRLCGDVRVNFNRISVGVDFKHGDIEDLSCIFWIFAESGRLLDCGNAVPMDIALIGFDIAAGADYNRCKIMDKYAQIGEYVASQGVDVPPIILAGIQAHLRNRPGFQSLCVNEQFGHELAQEIGATYVECSVGDRSAGVYLSDNNLDVSAVRDEVLRIGRGVMPNSVIERRVPPPRRFW